MGTLKFKTHIAHIYEVVTDGEQFGYNSYNEPKDGLVKVTTVYCELHTMKPDEQWHEFGRLVQGSYKLYLEPDTPIDSNSKIHVEGYKGYFIVKGDPQLHVYIPYIRAIVSREYKNQE